MIQALAALLTGLTVMAASLPFQSSEDLAFQSKSETVLLGLNKNNSFQGVIFREGLNSEKSRQLDFYKLKRSGGSSLKAADCQKYFQEIFGDPTELTLKVGSPQIHQSRRSGKVCIISLTDPDKAALFKERQLVLFKHKEDVYGLVFRFKKATTTEDLSDIHSFIDTLR